MNGAHDQQKSQRHNHQRHVVHDQVIAQINHTKQLATCHALQAIFTAGELGLQRHEERHLGQCQRNHRKIDALAANGQPAKDQAQRSTNQSAQQHADLRCKAPGLDAVTRHIGCAAQKRCVTEREQPGIAQQQIEGRSKQCKAHQLHHKHWVGTGKGCNDQAQQQQAVAHRGNALNKRLGFHVVRPLIFLYRTGQRGESAKQ